MNDMNGASTFPNEADIHAYVDGRMSEVNRARMEAWLAGNPVRAEELQGWRRDAQQLRAAYGSLTAAAVPSAFDPVTIRTGRHRRIRAQAALAAALVLTLCVGVAGGWQARRLTASETIAPMADALQAYRMFASNRQLKLDVTRRHSSQLQAWLEQHFHDAPQLPDLDAADFHPVGARLLVTDAGPAAMVLYENPLGGIISFYIRPPSSVNGMLPRGQRRDGPLVATYWSGNGYNYALVSRANATEVRVIHEASLLPST